MRKYKLYLDDILESIGKIERYTENISSCSEFAGNTLIVDGVVRNLEIIGEAAKNLPAEFRKKHQDVEWKKIAGLRDILIHAYSGIDLKIVWDIVANKIPGLKNSIGKMLR